MSDPKQPRTRKPQAPWEIAEQRFSDLFGANGDARQKVIDDWCELEPDEQRFYLAELLYLSIQAQGADYRVQRAQLERLDSLLDALPEPGEEPDEPEEEPSPPGEEPPPARSEEPPKGEEPPKPKGSEARRRREAREAAEGGGDDDGGGGGG